MLMHHLQYMHWMSKKMLLNDTNHNVLIDSQAHLVAAFQLLCMCAFGLMNNKH